jgi:hypothetical protein
MSASTVFSGARAVLKMSNKPVGYAVNCSGTTGINYQPLSVLGHLEVVEHVPTAYTVEFSASLARVAALTRLNSSAGFPTLSEGIEGATDSQQIMPAFATDGTPILQSGEMASVIQDRVTKGSLYSIAGVKCSQKAWEISAGGMVAENCTFVARIMNEGGENTGVIADAA